MPATRIPSPNMRQRCARSVTRTALTTLLAGALLMMSSSASAAVISSGITCVLQTCTVEPDGGPVAVDPGGFTLEVAWSSQMLELLGVIDSGDWWALNLEFDFTGAHGGVDNWGVITLLDQMGNAIGFGDGLNPQFDDSNPVGNTLMVNYEIHNSGLANQNHFIYGFRLALSDSPGLVTMDWVSARFSPAAVHIAPVAERATLLLLGVGLGAAGLRRYRRSSMGR